MLGVADLDTVSADRLEDAHVLLRAGRISGSVYMVGYAVEVALKSRICKTLGWSGFPETGQEFKNLQSLRTHDLEILLRLSGLEAAVTANHVAAWSVVLDWDPSKRYVVSGKSTPEKAGAMVSAATILVGIL